MDATTTYSTVARESHIITDTLGLREGQGQALDGELFPLVKQEELRNFQLRSAPLVTQNS